MRGENLLSFDESVELLEGYGIPLAPHEIVTEVEQAVGAAARIGFPVALKLISPRWSHKSDAGLVLLGIESPDEARSAAEKLFGTADAGAEGVLVQKMVPDGIEMIAGVTTDEQFGPMLVVGSGGILVEVLDDVVMGMPPLTGRQALEMVRKTRSWKLLQGYRGRPPADVDSFVRLLVNLSRLAVDRGEEVASLDLNPVLVLPEGRGCVVVDWRIFRNRSGGENGEDSDIAGVPWQNPDQGV